MRTLVNWIIATAVIIAFLAVIGNFEAFLESRFPNP